MRRPRGCPATPSRCGRPSHLPPCLSLPPWRLTQRAGEGAQRTREAATKQSHDAAVAAKVARLKVPQHGARHSRSAHQSGENDANGSRASWKAQRAAATAPCPPKPATVGKAVQSLAVEAAALAVQVASKAAVVAAVAQEAAAAAAAAVAAAEEEAAAAAASPAVVDAARAEVVAAAGSDTTSSGGVRSCPSSPSAEKTANTVAQDLFEAIADGLVEHLSVDDSAEEEEAEEEAEAEAEAEGRRPRGTLASPWFFDDPWRKLGELGLGVYRQVRRLSALVCCRCTNSVVHGQPGASLAPRRTRPRCLSPDACGRGTVLGRGRHPGGRGAAAPAVAGGARGGGRRRRAAVRGLLRAAARRCRLWDARLY
jgi:hypothetical protein